MKHVLIIYLFDFMNNNIFIYIFVQTLDILIVQLDVFYGGSTSYIYWSSSKNMSVS